MEKKILAVIPGRGGSKGIPRKNIRLVGGKPLLFWTISEAKRSRYLDRIVLSSEDEEVISIAQELGCEVPFTRPKELAQDDTSGEAPFLHAIEKLPGYDCAVLLHGAVYVVDIPYYLRERKLISPQTLGYVMPKERSLDIDDEWDLETAHHFLSKRTTVTS